MISTKFSAKFIYITFLFALMPTIAFWAIWMMPDDVEPAWKITFYAFAAIFTTYLLYRLIYSTRSISVGKDGTMYVKRLFGLINEAEVSLKKFDGYRLEYLHTGRKGKDVYGYFCLIKQEKVCAKICFNNYADFFDFLEEGINPFIKRITHYKKQEKP